MMTSTLTIHKIAIAIASAVGLHVIPGAGVKGDGNCFISAIVSQEISFCLKMLLYQYIYPFIADNGPIGDLPGTKQPEYSGVEGVDCSIGEKQHGGLQLF